MQQQSWDVIQKKNVHRPLISDLSGEEPPPIPKEALKKSSQAVIIKTKSANKKRKQNKSWILAFLSLSLLSFLSLVYYDFQKIQPELISAPEGLSQKQYNQFKSAIHTPFDHLMIKPILAKDLSRLWLASNWPKEEKLLVSFESVKGKTLDNKSFAFESRATLKEGRALLEDLRVSKGIDWVPGLYHFKVRPIESSASDNFWLRLTARASIPMPSYRGQVLFGFKNEQELKEVLKLNKEKQFAEQEKVWSDIRGKYQMLLSLSSQIKALMKNVFIGKRTVANWKVNLETFERRYKRNFGMLFTQFVLENSKGKSELILAGIDPKKRDLAHRSYRGLTRSAQSLGELSMGILQKLELKNKFPSPKAERQLVKHISRELGLFQKQVKGRLRELEAQIE